MNTTCKINGASRACASTGTVKAKRGRPKKKSNKELQCIWSNEADRTRFSLLSADGEEWACVVKPKIGYDIVVAIEKKFPQSYSGGLLFLCKAGSYSFNN